MLPEDRNELSLEKLRAGDEEEWEKAFPILWEVAWRTVGKVSPRSTDSEREELAAAALSGEGKVVSQITNPTREAFIKAMTFNDILNLTASVVRNTTIDRIRKSVIRADEKNQDRVRELFESGGNPGDDELSRERSEILAIAVGELRDRYREVIEDYYFLELSTEEIARKRDRPKGSVCVELKRARVELRKKLESFQGVGR